MPELPPDIARRQKQNRGQLVPLGPAPTGYHLTVTGQTPFQYDWRQPPPASVQKYPTTPDGELSAPEDTLVIARDDKSLWINLDGETDWREVGSGAALGTPTDWIEGEVESTIGPFGWNTSEQPITFGPSPSGLSGLSHGTALELASGGVEAQEDGYYIVRGHVLMQPVTPTAAYTFAHLRLRAFRSFTLSGDDLGGSDVRTSVAPAIGPGGVTYHANLPFEWFGYLMTGDTVEVFAQMSAVSDPSSDWEVPQGFVQAEKLG